MTDIRTGVTETGTAVQAELIVGGMSCGACAARIERRLNRLDGVTASVNYATGRAYFARTGGREPGELIGVIQSCGYTAVTPAPETGPQDLAAEQAARALGLRLAVCVPLAAAVIALAMIPALEFTGWPWVSLVLATPVAVWGAWPLHRAAWAGLGHGAATKDTLVSMAVAVSFGWSVYALFTVVGDNAMRMSTGVMFGLASGSHPLYLDVAAGSPPRYWPAATWRRGPGRGRAPRSPRWPASAPRPSRSCATAASSGCRWRRSAWASSSWCAPVRRSPWTGSSPRAARR